MICLDTSIIIDYLKGEPGVIDIIKSYETNEKMTTTAITKYELLRHQDKIKREVALEFLSKLEVYPFDDRSTVEAARIYRDLKTRGKEINKNDILIASIAFVNNQIVVTRDPDFKNLEGSNRVRVF